MSKNSLADLKSGLVVFLVALPLCLGVALAQNTPLFSGIVSGIIGGIIVAFISGSRLSVSGPAVGLTAIVISSVNTLGSFEAFLAAMLLAGVIQVILGVVKAGIIAHYFPSSVIKGMLASIGLILIVKQIPHLIGYDADPEGDMAFIQSDGHNTISEISYMLNYISPGSAIIGAISIFVLLAWESKWLKRFRLFSILPGALLVVVLGILINEVLLRYYPEIDVKPEHLVSLPHFGSFNDFSTHLNFPAFEAFANPALYEVALTIALVSSLITLLSIEAIDKLDPENHITPANRELVAQGIGNMVCGLLGGIPISSVIIRSSANLNAGATSRMSSVFHGIMFVLCLMFIPDILEKIPYSALAAILIFTGYKLCAPSLFKKAYKAGWEQFLPFVITIVVMMLTDLLRGVTVGILVGIVFILRQNYRNPFKIVHDTIDGIPHYFIKLSQNVTFLNKGKIVETLHALPRGAKVFIDGGRAQFVDRDVLEAICEFKRASKTNGIEVSLEEIKEVELLS